MLNGMNDMMAPLMGLTMTYWELFSIVLLVVLVLLAVWLFQQVRQGSGSNASHAPNT